MSGPLPGLYTDENVHGALVRTLVRAGFEVVVGTRELRVGAGDEEHFARAALLDRVLLSADQDMLAIAARWQQEQRPLRALVFFHLEDSPHIGRVVGRVLESLQRIGPDGLRNAVLYL